jgi:uncharacterized membrane protein YtjA (UPF0391 family)
MRGISAISIMVASAEAMSFCHQFWRTPMLRYALILLVVALVAAFFGFSGVAGTAAGIAQILFYIFLAIFVVSLIMNLLKRA